MIYNSIKKVLIKILKYHETLHFVDCLAQGLMTEVLKYPSYKMAALLKIYSKQTSKNLDDIICTSKLTK